MIKITRDTFGYTLLNIYTYEEYAASAAHDVIAVEEAILTEDHAMLFRFFLE